MWRNQNGYQAVLKKVSLVLNMYPLILLWISYQFAFGIHVTYCENTSIKKYLYLKTWDLTFHNPFTGPTTTSLEQLSKDYRYSRIGWCVSPDFGQWQRAVARPCCHPSFGLKRGCDCLAGQSDKSFRCISKGNTTRSRKTR